MSLSKFLSVVVALCGVVEIYSIVDIDLDDLHFVKKFEIGGSAPNNNFGYDVSAAGDFNGDGIADLVVSGFTLNIDKLEYDGEAYVLFGRSHLANMDLSTFVPGPSSGFRIYGPARMVSGAGDINGDGFDDIVIQAQSNAFVIYGFNESTRVVADLSLSSLELGSVGFVIKPFADSESDESLEPSITRAGDVNADGIDDLLICYAALTYNNRDSCGVCYVIFGTIENTHTTLYLDHFVSSAVTGYRIIGAQEGDMLGYTTAGSIDLNDDGVHDAVMSGFGVDTPIYVIFGHGRAFAYADIDLQDKQILTTVLKITNRIDHGRCKYALTSALDVNGDGVNDLAIGCMKTRTAAGAYTGSVTLIFGHVECDPYMYNIDINTLVEGVEGYSIYGPGADARFGSSVASGDINGDGLSDLLIGASSASYSGTDGNHVVYVVHTTTATTTTTTNTPDTTIVYNTDTTPNASHTPLFRHIDLSNSEVANEVVAMRVLGEEEQEGSAASVRNIGDINHDGKVDFAFTSAHSVYKNRNKAGVVYVMSDFSV